MSRVGKIFQLNMFAPLVCLIFVLYFCLQDILVEFKELSNHWLKKDHISTYVGIRCWLLEIRRRRDKRRCTINGGWLMFREDLHLDVGDTCTFQWRDDSIRNFNVVVQKRVVDLD